jgi:hypothetical protein
MTDSAQQDISIRQKGEEADTDDLKYSTVSPCKEMVESAKHAKEQKSRR